MPRSVEQVSERRERLKRLASLLAKAPRTAQEISLALGCTKATAYQWVRALEDELGYRLVEEERPGRSGPPATAYSVRRRMRE